MVGSGVLQRNGVFKADEILAKHDENYMPPEVADTLKKKPPFVDEEGGAGGQPAEGKY